MIKEEISIIKKKGINYLLSEGKLIRQKPWLGDLFSFMYDSIMEKSIFPKKFKADINKHEEILKQFYKDLHEYSILELACGSGNLSELLPDDNSYSGVDISPGLIRTAVKKFNKKEFTEPQFYISDASLLPFKDSVFDICICNLSLNFFPDTKGIAKEIKRILKKDGIFYCSVPVPERKPEDSIIRGTLPPAAELEKIFTEAGFLFQETDIINGALFYFSAVKK